MKHLFYHAGCPTCLDALRFVESDTSTDLYDSLEVVHLGEKKDRIAEAKAYGVKSVPALVQADVAAGEARVFHINHGADLDALPRE